MAETAVGDAAVGGGPVSVPGLTDAHTHLLRAAAQIPFPWDNRPVADYHHEVAGSGQTPMDVPEPPPPGTPADLADRLLAALSGAAQAGLTEITEMGMRSWCYLDALELLQRRAPLPTRVRIYVASGLADQAGLPEVKARRSAAGPWVSLDGVKFYADGWLVPRTCAMCRPFSDSAGDGLLFQDAATLARRIGPLAAAGLRIATHAIGDRGIAAVLDAYELAWDADPAAIAAAAPRLEHASVQSAELTARITELGVVACIQPSFPVTDAGEVMAALGPDRHAAAYPWAALAAAGASILSGSDYPLEVLDPLVGLARLVNGHSTRDGFRSGNRAPASSRLPVPIAFALSSDPASGETLLSADPREVPADGIDRITVHGTVPRPLR